MRYKRIKGYAHDIALQFAHSANHLAWLAMQSGEPEVVLDLMSGEIAPLLFDVPRNRIVLGMCQKTFQRMQEREGLPGLRAARLTARFGPEHPGKDSLGTEYECVITDALGRAHSGIYADRTLPQP